MAEEKKATEATETAETEAGKEKKERKTSTAVLARDALIKLFDEVMTAGKNLTDLVSKKTAESIANLVNEIKSSSRGLPAPERLALVQKDIEAHWKSMPIKNGRVVVDAEWNDRAQALLNRESRIKREISEGGASRGKGGKKNNENKADAATAS